MTMTSTCLWFDTEGPAAAEHDVPTYPRSVKIGIAELERTADDA